MTPDDEKKDEQKKARKKKTAQMAKTRAKKKAVKETVDKATTAGPSRKAKRTRDIGVDVVPPKKVCTDVNCPFHGTLSVRGQIMECEVVSDRMAKGAVVKRARLRFVRKYERYEKMSSRYSVHNPPCIDAKKGDKVKIMECRPLSKTKSFVIIEKRGAE